MSHWKRGKDILKSIMFIFVMIAFLQSTISVIHISAGSWVYHDESDRESDVLKPVDPVFINSIGGTIQIDPDPDPDLHKWDLIYPLEAGKRYHVFLVGEWVDNGTEPDTDYDIKTYDPYGDLISIHTESAGLPEHVANDDRHQYFVPEETGDYLFRVINDPRDSKNTRAAVFMVIEQITVNQWYTIYLEGRDERTDEELLYTGWAYALNTSAPRIRVFVDVPSTLDMYEARLYAMANPDKNVGYLLDDIGIPSGGLFNTFTRDYGGFNTSCKGDRNPEAMASCEYSGQDMRFAYEKPESGKESNIFYYLALIAEHGEGTVKFYVQTDFIPPNITLVDPPDLGYASEKTEIKASVEDDSKIQRVWAEFTDDGGETWGEEELLLQGDSYVGELPPFSTNIYVDYKVYAEDDFGSISFLESGFPVKNRVTIDLSMAKPTVKSGNKAVVSGTITSKTPVDVFLNFMKGDFVDKKPVKQEDSGFFTYSYKPGETGEWNLQAYYEGDELNHPSSSDLLTFIVEKEPTSVDCTLSKNEVKKTRPVTVSGTVTPRVEGLTVLVTFTSPTSYHTEYLLTDNEGGFSYKLKPRETGVWNVLTQVKDDNLHFASSQSDLMEFLVAPLGPLDIVVNILILMVTPPFQYLTVAVVGLGVTLAIYKEGNRLAPILPKSIAKFFVNRKSGRRSGKKNARYRRDRR